MTVQLPQIETKRLYQQIASVLRKSIDDGTFPVHSYLPPERDLAEQLGVSRTSVREALVALEVEGLVSVKVGTGVQVLAPNTKSALLHLTHPEIGPLVLLDARLLVEPEIASLAAQNATSKDVSALNVICDQMVLEYQRDTRKHEADRAFHLYLARISNNPALELIDTVLWNQRTGPLQERIEHLFAPEERFEATMREHRSIIEALSGRKPEQAKQAMHDHLYRVRSTLAREIENS